MAGEMASHTLQCRLIRSSAVVRSAGIWELAIEECIPNAGATRDSSGSQPSLAVVESVVHLFFDGVQDLAAAPQFLTAGLQA